MTTFQRSNHFFKSLNCTSKHVVQWTSAKESGNKTACDIYLNVFRLFNKLLTQCTVVGTHLVKARRIALNQKMKGNIEPRRQIIEQYNLEASKWWNMWQDERDRKFQPTYNHHLELLCNSQITWFHNMVQQKLAFRRMDNIFWFNSNWYSARRHIWDLCSVLPAPALTKTGVGPCKIRRMALLRNTRRYFTLSLFIIF